VQRGAPGADGAHGRRGAGERLRGEVRVVVDQQVHAVRVPVQRGQVQRRQPAARRLVHEAAANGRMSAARRVASIDWFDRTRRRCSPVAGDDGRQQQPDAPDVASGRRGVQRRPAAHAVHLRHLQFRYQFSIAIYLFISDRTGAWQKQIPQGSITSTRTRE
jgi:hypothetical protein